MSDREELMALRRLAELESRAAGSPAAPTAAPAGPAVPAQGRTAGEQLGLGARAAIQGAASLPGLLYDVAAIPQNLLSRVPGLEKLRVEPAAKQISGALTAAGVPEPATPAERYLGSAVEGGAGVVGGGGLAKVLQKFGPAAVQQAANVLQAAPAQQAALGATGGAGAEAAQQFVGESASPTEKAIAGLVGGIAGTVAPGAAVAAGRRAVTPLPSRLTAEESRLIEAAKSEGIKLPVGVETGSPGMKLIESVLARLPGSGGMAQKQAQEAREQFQRAVMARAGETASDVSPATIDRAFGRLGQTFEDLAGRTTVRLDRPFFQEVNNIATDYVRRLPSDVKGVVASRIEDLLTPQGFARPQIQGQEFARVTSELKREARAYANRPEVQRALNALSEAIDNAAERSMGPALRQEWQDARREYRNLLAIDQAARSGTAADRTVGNLPLGAFQQAVRGQDKRGYARGRGELNLLSRIGNLMADKIPDSGTAQRTAMTNLLTLGGTGAAGGAIGGIPGILAGLALPPAVQAAIQSPAGRAYLTNQRMAGPSPMSPAARAAALANILAQQGASQ